MNKCTKKLIFIKKTEIFTILLVKILTVTAFLFFYSNDLFSQNLQEIKTMKDLGISGNVETVREKEIAVKGTKYDLIRKNVISEVEYKIVNGGKVLVKNSKIQGMETQYLYNSDNKITEINNFYVRNKTSAGRSLFFYDKAGNPTYELHYSAKNELQDSVVVSFGKSPDEIDKEHFNAQGQMYKTEDIHYNSLGKITRNVQTTNNSTTRIFFDYDSTVANITEERWYLGNKLVQKVRYLYNEKGNLVEKMDLDEKDEPYASTHYEYDILSGFVTTIKTTNHTTSFEYNFDNNNNWVTKYEFYDEYPVKIIEREITYKDTK